MFHAQLGKITIKGTTQVNGHSLKLHFCMFERSQKKHNSLDRQSLHVQNLTQIKKLFCMFKALKPQKWTIIIFFKRPFFYQMCTIPFEN
jgi:hypothetical protein